MRSGSLVCDKLPAAMHALVKVSGTFAYLAVGREIVARWTGTRVASLCVQTVVGTRLEAAAFVVICNTTLLLERCNPTGRQSMFSLDRELTQKAVRWEAMVISF